MMDLTLTELLEQVTRLGGDPSTTVIQVRGVILDADAFDLGRENGTLVATLLVANDSADALRDDEAYEIWRLRQVPVPAKLTARLRAQAAAYVEECAA